MVQRPFWLGRLEEAWKEAPIVWLSGVRRSGKTTLARSLGEERVFYVNCDLPVVEEMVRDPALFFRGCPKPIVVFDEIHQLRDPSRVLKIGADMFPRLRILATGSSTLAASKKFRDTLAGRKRQVHLVPVLWSELPAFGTTLPRRLFHGGLPPALLAHDKSPSLYREWMDSFFARDIQRLFAFRDVNRFNALFEYLLRQSAGQLEVTRTAAALGISRPTVQTHLQALEITHAITLVRPFHGSGQKELLKMPKVYGFDTGFVSFARGWDPLRPEDLGILWEHVVLEYLLRQSAGQLECGRTTRGSSGNTWCWNTSRRITPRGRSATGATRPAARWTSCSLARTTPWTPSSARGTPPPSTPPPCSSSGPTIRAAPTTS